jgi:transcription elongation factor Elf1
MEEHFFQCPHCWETISVLIDLSINDQNYVEDCEVCCNPLHFEIKIQNQQITSFSVNFLGQ